MRAQYGYQDASGNYFITLDTDRCNGCGDCERACPAAVFTVLDKDPNDPFREDPVAVIPVDKQRRLKYLCNPCKPSSRGAPLPCVHACRTGAIEHSW